jgi:hypothetical protein
MALYDEHERLDASERRRMNERMRSGNTSSIGLAFAVGVLALIGLLFILGVQTGNDASRTNTSATPSAPVTTPQTPTPSTRAK